MSHTHSVSASGPTEPSEVHRLALWEYYDRRVAERLPDVANAHAYWTGLGLEVAIEDIAEEVSQLEQRLRALSPAQFVDVGAGPGTFTGLLPGTGFAIDQSLRALRALRVLAPQVPVVRADALHLPLADRSVRRFFAAHLYGLLLPDERENLLAEAQRVQRRSSFSMPVVRAEYRRPSGRSERCTTASHTASFEGISTPRCWPPRSEE